MIVARAFVGTGADERSRLAVDPRASFHGTHVAGIAAGNAGTNAPAGGDHPATTGLAGVAPRAQLGNYRVFNVPTSGGHMANTPEIVAAFESAVADGMDVINFSGGGPQTEPLSDALVEAVRNVAAAGVVPVISAGNDRDDYGLGSAGSPGTAPDAISVAALSNSHVFSPALRLVAGDAPAPLTRVPFVGAGGTRAPPAWSAGDQVLVDVGTIVGVDGAPVPRKLCGPPGNLEGGRYTAAGRLALGLDRARLARRLLVRLKANRARDAGAIGVVYVDNRSGEANGIPVQLEVPAGMISDLDGEHLRSYLAGRGGRAAIRVGRQPEELATGRSGVVTSFSSGGLTAVRPPAQAGRRRTRRPDPLLHARGRRRPLRRLRRHEHGSAARRGRGGAPAPASSRLVAPPGQVGARSTAAAAWADTARTSRRRS